MSACSRDAACSGNPPIPVMTKPSFETQAKLYYALRRLEISHFRKVGSRPPWSVPDIQEGLVPDTREKVCSGNTPRPGTEQLFRKNGNQHHASENSLLPSGREKVPDTRSMVCSGNIPLPATALEEVQTVVSDRREAAMFHHGFWKYDS